MKYWTGTILVLVMMTVLMALTVIPVGAADVPMRINYQGYLTDDVGNPIDGNTQIAFRIYDTSASGTGTQKWNEVLTVPIAGGLFSVVLGGSSVMTADVFDTASWLEIEIESDGPMDPRQEISSAVYAIHSQNTETLDGMDSSDFSSPGHNHLTETWSGTSTGIGLTMTGNNNSGGILSVTNSNANDGSGVFGNGLYGVYGYSSNLVGVYGRSDKEYGIGGYFYALGDQDGTDVSAGAYGRNDAQNTDSFGVVGHAYWDGVGVGAWSYTGNLIEAYDGDYPSGNLEFYVDQDGYAWANGGWSTFKSISEPATAPAKSTMDSNVSASEPEYCALYAVSSPEAWFEDFGSERLISGEAVVKIDTIFAKVVTLTNDYRVFVTPTSSQPVITYINEKTPDSFVVGGVKLDGSPADCSFDYRIVATQRGQEGKRLESVDIKHRESVQNISSNETLKMQNADLPPIPFK